MTESNPSPLLGVPVLDVPHPKPAESSLTVPGATPSGPPKRVAVPSASKTIVGSASSIPTRAVGSAQKTIVGFVGEPSVAADSAALARSAPSEAAGPTLPDTPASLHVHRQTAAMVSPLVPVHADEPLEVPTTSTSPALWLLIVAIFAVLAGVAYTL